MPAATPYVGSRLQALFLLVLVTCFVPLTTCLTVGARVVAPYLHITKHIATRRRWREISSSTFRPRTVLITGVSSPFGLSLARTFYHAGHRVIGADFDKWTPARFSVAFEIFYAIASPVTGDKGRQLYIRDITDLCKKEKVELWVPCSALPSLATDIEVQQLVQKSTGCRAMISEWPSTEALKDNSTLHPCGVAYLTQGLFIRGNLKSFSASPDASSAFPYSSQRALPPTSALHIALMTHTHRRARTTSSTYTGHLALAVELSRSAPSNAMSYTEILPHLQVISQSPRPSSVAMSFEGRSEDVAEAYLSLLARHEPKGVVTGHYDENEVVLVNDRAPGRYSIGLEVLRLVVLPVLELLQLKTGIWNVLGSWSGFIEKITCSKEIHWEVWDPWVMWWRYCLWIPLQLCEYIMTGQTWHLEAIGLPLKKATRYDE